ncbi:MAG: hypothetical protein JXA50_04070 [Deltaproteobacteria bacterium]|nr:hypothetical protein [Deltaproteobacteria bacterium]
MKKIQKILPFLFIIISIPTLCFADGGGPILLIVNSYAFIVGQAWILLSEFIYLIILLRPISLPKGKIFKITFIMNLLSTIVGALLFPFLLALVTLPGTFYMNTKWGGLLMALGTWVAGDDSPYPKVAIGATITGLIITYILTVWIEYKYLNRLSKKRQIEFGNNLLKHCIFFNMVSYIGLIALFFIFSKF